jgi:thiol-disulfide isomerase/thioredoxin
MKKLIFLALTILLTSCSATSAPVLLIGKVTDCATIKSSALKNTSVANTKNTLSCLDGSAGRAISDLRGPLILNVWGSWCQPCTEEIPYFVEFYQSAAGKIGLIGVAVEEINAQAAQDFVVATGITWPNLFDKTGTTRSTFGMGVPVTWFIDQTGAVVFKKVGPIKSAQELRELTSKYLKVSL